MDEEIREQRSRLPRAALLRTALVSDARDVEMRPFESLREFAQERRRRDRAALTAADVGERKVPGGLPAAVVGAANQRDVSKLARARHYRELLGEQRADRAVARTQSVFGRQRHRAGRSHRARYSVR